MSTLKTRPVADRGVRRSKARQVEFTEVLAPVPKTMDLALLRKAARACKACPLYRNATQIVFGEGVPAARIVLLGEQPGDQEDREGKPFVGPAGRLLNEALEAAGIERSDCYVTNAVKHFKWEPRGKRRLHQKPNQSEVAACRPWWEAELGAIQPTYLVLLGSTAAQAVLGPQVRVTKQRGQIVETRWAKHTLITVHPSALLRMPDVETREREFARFVEDLQKVRK